MDSLMVFADYFADTNTPFDQEGEYITAQAVMGLLARQRVHIEEHHDGSIGVSLLLTRAYSERGQALINFISPILNSRVALLKDNEVWWTIGGLEHAWDKDSIENLMQQIADEITWIESFLDLGMLYPDESFESLLRRSFSPTLGRV